MSSETSSKEDTTTHLEKSDYDDRRRRRSSVTEIAHNDLPVYEIRKSYTKQGM